MPLQLPKAVTNLQQHLLVATAALNDTEFARSLIFVAHHDTAGSMGFMINQPLPRLGFADVARSMGIEEMLAQGREQPIMYKGGPVETTRGFVLHSTDYSLKSSVRLNGDFALSAQADIVTDIARGHGPRQLNFCLGYAGWGSGQLEQELIENEWLILPATRELVFEVPPHQRYVHATRMLGLNPLNFPGGIIGQA
jgi:putative transcriptional regulator